MSDKLSEVRPFLTRFGESEQSLHLPANASPEQGGESNPIEEGEGPRPEPTSPTPWGD